MKEAVPFFLLLLATYNSGSDLKQALDIEDDRSQIEATRRLLDDARARAQADLAQSAGDPIAKARAELVLHGLDTIERRSNLAAIIRQVQQTRESFREEEWREFQGGAALWPVGGIGAALGAQGMYELFVLSVDRPPPQSADQLLDRVTVLVDALERSGPLPQEIGDYLAWSVLKRAADANPQAADLPGPQQADFLCQQTRARLNDLLRNEPSDERIEILNRALQMLAAQCPGSADLPAGDTAQGFPPEDCEAWARSINPDIADYSRNFWYVLCTGWKAEQ
jgi:hypothetical protein